MATFGCYKDVYVNFFFPRRSRLWISLPIECFPLTYDLNGVESRINRHLLTVLNRFPVCFNLFVLLFLVTSCLVLAVYCCMESWSEAQFEKRRAATNLNAMPYEFHANGIIWKV